MIERVIISITLMISMALILAANMTLPADDPIRDDFTTIAFIQDTRQWGAHQGGIFSREKDRAARAQDLKKFLSL
jgi:hypothetical protein